MIVNNVKTIKQNLQKKWRERKKRYNLKSNCEIGMELNLIDEVRETSSLAAN